MIILGMLIYHPPSPKKAMKIPKIKLQKTTTVGEKDEYSYII